MMEIYRSRAGKALARAARGVYAWEAMETLELWLEPAVGAVLLFAASFAAWRVAQDRRASRAAALRPQPLRRPGERLRLPSADETRMSVARFRRVVGEWALLEKRAESLARRAEALRRRGVL